MLPGSDLGIASYRKYHRFPSVGKFIATLVYSLFFNPFFAIAGVIVTNCYLDTGAPVERNTVIVHKHKHQSTHRGRWVYYYVYVRSWRSDKSDIKIKVGSREFSEFNTGDMVTVGTKRGLWDLEWVCDVTRSETKVASDLQ